MEKENFLRELEYLLMDLPEEERQEALQYYRDYFEEAGPEQEAEVAGKLGSPEKVAAELKGSLAGCEDGGEFSERGYRAEWYAEDNRMPDQYAEIIPKSFEAQDDGAKQYNGTDFDNRQSRDKRQKQHAKSGHWHTQWETDDQEKSKNDAAISRRRNGLLIFLLFLFFGIPLAGTIISAGFSVVTGIVAALLGGFGGLFGLIAGGIALVFGLLVTGAALVIAGCVNMSVPAIGAMVIGWGFLVLAVAFLLAVLVKWACTTVVPSLIHFCIDIAKKCCRWLRGIVCRLRGRGGATE